MIILFYVPGMSFHGGTLAEGKSLGGSETSAYYLARELAARGHGVTVFSNIPPEQQGEWEGVRYMTIGAPNQNHPNGEVFEKYAIGTPSDVLICQRKPDVFARVYASKINLWWTHDLALKRFYAHVANQWWNVNGMLVVSEWHRNQIAGVYDLPPERIHVIRNAVDLSWFKGSVEAEQKRQGRWLMYTSRPERGLNYLVEPGMLMDKLREADPEITLKIAGYDNTVPEMRPLYEYLWARCRSLPNVEMLGPLSKADLALHMESAWLHVYPTLFEEVSCISAMEEQAAGTPFIASPVAALPETLADGGVAWVQHKADGQPDIDGFAKMILSLRDHPEKWQRLHEQALFKGKTYRYSDSAAELERVVEQCFKEASDQQPRLFRHLIRMGDVEAARTIAAPPEQHDELRQHYAFTESETTLKVQYDRISEWEQARGIGQGQGDYNYLSSPGRIQALMADLRMLPPGSRVLDYACGQGHHTDLFAHLFPHLDFTGADWCDLSIQAGRKYLEADPKQNCHLFTTIELEAHDQSERWDAVILGEVIEHQPDPAAFVDRVERYAREGGIVFASIPWGPWEADGRDLARGRPTAQMRSTDDFRAHLHHLEPQDLRELLENKPGFRMVIVPYGWSWRQEAMGCTHLSWRYEPGQQPCGKVDWARKLKEQAPQQTLALCMICRPYTAALHKALDSIKVIADEIIIGVDGGPSGERVDGNVWSIAEDYGAHAFPIIGPLTQGFGPARNATIVKAKADWILWMDDDEVLQWPERVCKFLRPNVYDAYAVPHHHYSVEPPGITKTDLPTRIFRNRKGIQFFGLVHEHPEKEINKGPGRVSVINEIAIAHSGYETEDIRRQRFQRNLPLMEREWREQKPQRLLHKMLMLRDLAHMNRYDMMAGQGVPEVMGKRAQDGIALWRELVGLGEIRLAVESLPYLSECTHMLMGDGGFRAAMGISAAWRGIGNLNGKGPDIVAAEFPAPEDAKALSDLLSREIVKGYQTRYF